MVSRHKFQAFQVAYAPVAVPVVDEIREKRRKKWADLGMYKRENIKHLLKI